MTTETKCRVLECEKVAATDTCGYGRCADHCADRCLHRQKRATVRELTGDIGKRAMVRVQAPKGLTLEAEILDIKQSYGKTRWLVKPVAGTGECWVEEVDIIE